MFKGNDALNIDKDEANDHGASNTFYAKSDGSLAPAGSGNDMLSPTTGSWLGFVMANPGAYYP